MKLFKGILQIFSWLKAKYFCRQKNLARDWLILIMLRTIEKEARFDDQIIDFQFNIIIRGTFDSKFFDLI